VTALEAADMGRGASRLAAPLAHWGRGRLALGLAVLGLFALAGGALAREFPVASTGDIWFQADHAGFQDPGGKVIEEYYFRIVNNQITFEADDDDSTYRGRLFVSLKFKDKDGDDVAKAGHDFSFSVIGEKLAESPDDAQVLVIREPLHPRAASVQITVEDMKGRKRGLLYLLTGKRKSGEAEASLRPPPFVGKQFGLSDIQFAWEVIQNVTNGSFQKNGLEVIPNPQRSYGLLQPHLTAYYEIYDHRQNAPDSTTYIVRHEIVDSGGNVLHTNPDTVSARGAEWVKVVRFDLAKLPTGQYRMRAVVMHPATMDSTIGERTFSLLWKTDLWERTEQDILDEARVLFREEEFDRFKTMSPGDRATYMDDFWLQEDPTPGAARNELREEFLRRVGFANREFQEQGRRGMLTDRGRIYIRFGEPDEIERQLMPIEGDDLQQYVPGLTKEDPSGKMLAKPNQTDTRPFEMWSYTRQGQPLFPEREKSTTVTGLRFVFVDETGVGHYVLQYSSDFIGY
jgi:GWxTD domain-containing protein